MDEDIKQTYYFETEKRIHRFGHDSIRWIKRMAYSDNFCEI